MLLPHRGHRGGRDPLDDRQGRGLRLEHTEELAHPGVVALDLEKDALGVVAHESREVEALGQTEDERPEADALNDPFDADPCSHPAAGGRRRHCGLSGAEASASWTSVHSTW